jgi:arylsulfatase A-like enzyme
MISFRLLAALSVCATTRAAETPNILFISVEDWTTNAIGCYGNPAVKTPNIDQLAASGIRFERAYAQSTVCNPSRASFVTGLYPDSTRVFTNDESMDELVPKDAPSLAATLATKPGAWLAQTGKLVHKWEDAGRFAKGFNRIEYAHHYDIPPGFEGELLKLPHGPIDTGDDVEKEAFFVPNKIASAKLRLLHAEREAALAAGKPDNWATRKPFQQYFAEQIGDSGLDAASMEDGRIARSAAKLLGEIAEKKEPFFLSVGFYSTHTPLLAPKEFVEMYDPAKIRLSATDPANDQGIPKIAKRNGQNYDIFNGMYPEFGPTPERQRAAIAAYYACSSYVDAQIGILLDALEKHGLTENTIVIVFSDHGFHLGEHGLWSKFTLFEESTRVPLIIRAPGHAGNGQTCTSIVELVDLFPTLCDLWRIEKPASLHGRSMVPLLDDPSKPFKQAARFVVALGGLGRGIRTATHRYTEYHADRSLPDAATSPLATELYDLTKDSREQHNLANDQGHAAVAESLRKRLLSP